LEAVSEGKASVHLLQGTVVVQRLRDAKLPDIEARLAKLREGLPPLDDRIRQMISERREQIATGQPNPARGQQVFEKHCAICHQMGGKGTKVGPQLDGIGARGVDRLLEDILDPNRNVDRNYRSTIIALTNGRVLTGLVLREEPNVLVLADAEGKTHEIQLGQIAERRSSSLSPMPNNALDRISESDLCDLVGYLLESRTEAQSAKHQ
jgi:putative heme-binding domain-containing protein